MRKILIILSALLAAACAPQQTEPETLTGNWILTAANGVRYPVQIRQLSGDRIVVVADKAFLSGRYSYAAGRMASIALHQPGVKAVEMRSLEGGRFLVTRAPSAARFGFQLQDAILSRADRDGGWGG
ncbi:hypothetical protein PVT68_12675 [Microbulbifer bruguierae]|uniref:Lipocalin-like domain-containing protein n=1 Tax=Microbulbifer bruguierae TaxID=3029061 RepID=A0ABY8NC41_9GAMM|nr:hypothetical protein [Microbulbifer bruguierae]WGL15622.1 hypothetical protein PVT68_12675 [Microbulbifer bruguierae]